MTSENTNYPLLCATISWSVCFYYIKLFLIIQIIFYNIHNIFMFFWSGLLNCHCVHARIKQIQPYPHLPLMILPSKEVTSTWWHQAWAETCEKLPYGPESLPVLSRNENHPDCIPNKGFLFYFFLFFSFSFICTLDRLDETDMPQPAVLDLWRTCYWLSTLSWSSGSIIRVKGQRGEWTRGYIILPSDVQPKTKLLPPPPFFRIRY